MDWDLAINRQREHLTRIIAALFAMLDLGSGDGASIPPISPALRRAVLRILYPAESAVRRLIVVMARGLVAKLPAKRALPPNLRNFERQGAGRASFQLCDPRRALFVIDRVRGPRFEPRIHAFADGRLVTILGRSPLEAKPLRSDADCTARLCRRLHAIKFALENLPREAKRLARWRARRATLPPEKIRRQLRLGPPPGHVGNPFMRWMRC